MKKFSRLSLVLVALLIIFYVLFVLIQSARNSYEQKCKLNMWQLGRAEEEFFINFRSYTNDPRELVKYLPNALILRCPSDPLSEYILGADSTCYTVDCPGVDHYHGSVGCGE